jgi:hypothetical protein
MQVYVAVTDGNSVLIVRKRVQCTYGNRGLQNPPWDMNAGGHWVLPGGRNNCTVCGQRYPNDLAKRVGVDCTCPNPTAESALAAGIREFTEESGVNLGAIVGAVQSVPINVQTKYGDYAVVRVVVSAADLATLLGQVTTNAAPSAANPAIPFLSGANGIKDWEWDTALTIQKATLRNYLGNTTNSLANAFPPHGKHAINWYHDIAVSPAL